MTSLCDILGLMENAIPHPSGKSTFGHQIDRCAEPLLKSILNGDQTKEAERVESINQQIDVAGGPCFAASNRTEDPQTTHAQVSQLGSMGIQQSTNVGEFHIAITWHWRGVGCRDRT